MPGIDAFSLSNHGLDGVPGIKKKSGTGTASTSSMTFTTYNSSGQSGLTSANFVHVVVDIGFLPKIVTIQQTINSGRRLFQSAYFEFLKDPLGRSVIGGGDIGVSQSFVLEGNSFVNESGFRLPVEPLGNVQVTWQAYGWDD